MKKEHEMKQRSGSVKKMLNNFVSCLDGVCLMPFDSTSVHMATKHHVDLRRHKWLAVHIIH
jgi:hypothetical protein